MEQRSIDASPSAAPEQLGAVVVRYRAALVKFFMKRCGDPAVAEDLAQEVFIRLAEQDDPARIVNLEAYLFQTAANLMRDRYRRDVTHHAGAHVSLEDCGYEGEVASEERVYIGREQLQIFLSLLAEMPERRRKVFLMKRLLGMSYGAIALKLGMSERMVERDMIKTLLHIHERMGSP